MKSRRRFLFVVMLVSALLSMSAATYGRPWNSPSGPGHNATSHPPSQEQTVENWVLIGIIVIGFVALTIRMLRYRREMQSSVLRRLRQELEEGRALLLSGRSFLKEHFDSGMLPDRRAAPRNGEGQANA